MYHLRTLRIVSLILGFALVALGCSKNKSKDFSDVTISAKAASEGILVTFTDYSLIPPEIDNIKIVFYDWGKEGEPDWNITDMLTVINFFHDTFRESFCENAIEQVRKNGKVVFPFVQKDHIYTVKALFINGDDIERSINTKCIAKKSVYLNKDINLNLNAEKTGVILSGKPAFTPNVKYELQKISYNIGIFTEEDWDWIAIASDKTDDLFWNFEPRFSEHLKEKNTPKGDYTSYAGVNINIIHNNISWVLEIVKSPIFTYSF